MIISIGHMNEISTDIYFFYWIRDESGGGGGVIINLLYSCVLGKRANKDLGPLVNEIWDSGTEHIH